MTNSGAPDDPDKTARMRGPKTTSIRRAFSEDPPEPPPKTKFPLSYRVDIAQAGLPK